MAIIQALRGLASAARDNGDAGFLACIAECILSCLASMVEYFNKVRPLRSFEKQFSLHRALFRGDPQPSLPFDPLTYPQN